MTEEERAMLHKAAELDHVVQIERRLLELERRVHGYDLQTGEPLRPKNSAQPPPLTFR